MIVLHLVRDSGYLCKTAIYSRSIYNPPPWIGFFLPSFNNQTDTTRLSIGYPLKMSFVGASPRVPNHDEAWVFVPTLHHDTYPAISTSSFNLAGKSVLVTGASRGIGRATAIHLAQAGASRIAIGARSPLQDIAAEIKSAAIAAGHPEPMVLSLSLDVASIASVEAAFATLAKAFDGVLDVLIANAGWCDFFNPIHETDPEKWTHTTNVNLNGSYLCTRYALPLILKSETKTIIIVSSIGACYISPGTSAYQTSKLALCRFAEFIDQEYHTQGVIAIASHPGGVQTDLAKAVPSEYHKYLIDTEELAADHMVWLAARRREWLSGRLVYSNWDVTELEAKKDEIVEKDLLKFRIALH